MSSSILGMNDFNSLFSPPTNSKNTNPLSNLMYGSATGKIYSNTVAKQIQSTTSKYMNAMKVSSNHLKADSSILTSHQTVKSVSSRTLSSTDAESVSGKAISGTTPTTHVINVSQIATNQVNKGTELASKAATSLSTGSHTFTIKSGTSEKNVSFDVGAKDTNQDSLNKIATAINQSNMGISAKVITNAEKGTSFLSITGNKTGSSSSFNLEGKYGSDAITAVGANTKISEAKNAKYTVDGKEYASENNTVTTDNGKTELTLKKATVKDVTVKVKPDSDKIVQDVQNMLNSYNDMINFAQNNPGIGAEKISSALDKISSSFGRSLSQIGIEKNADHTLKLNSNTLRSALENNLNRVQNTLSGDRGFADRLDQEAQKMLTRPSQYLNPAKSLMMDQRGTYVDIML